MSLGSVFQEALEVCRDLEEFGKPGQQVCARRIALLRHRAILMRAEFEGATRGRMPRQSALNRELEGFGVSSEIGIEGALAKVARAISDAGHDPDAGSAADGLAGVTAVLTSELSPMRDAFVGNVQATREAVERMAAAGERIAAALEALAVRGTIPGLAPGS